MVNEPNSRESDKMNAFMVVATFCPDTSMDAVESFVQLLPMARRWDLDVHLLNKAASPQVAS